jgi:hypothetical protein
MSPLLLLRGALRHHRLRRQHSRRRRPQHPDRVGPCCTSRVMRPALRALVGASAGVTRVPVRLTKRGGKHQNLNRTQVRKIQPARGLPSGRHLTLEFLQGLWGRCTLRVRCASRRGTFTN